MSKEPILFHEGLFLVFLHLKLSNHIDWSWWWVLAPFWIPALILGAAGIVMLLVALGIYLASFGSGRRW